MVLLAAMLFTAIAVVAFVLTAAQSRRHVRETRARLCRTCAQSHPPFAQYCRRCGTKLSL